MALILIVFKYCIKILLVSIAGCPLKLCAQGKHLSRLMLFPGLNPGPKWWIGGFSVWHVDCYSPMLIPHSCLRGDDNLTEQVDAGEFRPILIMAKQSLRNILGKRREGATHPKGK